MTKPVFAVRPYEPNDAGDFVTLNKEWIEAYFSLEADDETLFADPSAIIRSGGCILMATYGRRTVGTCALVKIDSVRFELAKMAVLPAMRGRGVGSLLMRAALAAGEVLGAKQFVLQTNARLISALRLYERTGFRRVEVDVTHTRFTRADVTMVYDLSANKIGMRS